MTIRNRLIQLSLIKHGNWFSMYEVLKRDPKLTQCQDEQSIQSLLNHPTIKIMTIVDDDYPSCFKEMERPPFVLYYQGNINLLSDKKIGMMGSNRPSIYGMQSCKTLVNQLMKEQVVIVGGLDLGIDAITHHICLRRGRSIAVLASGFDRIYPSENYQLYRSLSEQQLVISEFPPHTPINRQHLFLRNRVIKALSDVLMVIEATKEGKVTHVARQALYEGKSIYALPGEYNSVYSEGSLDLIKEGANCLTNYRDVLDELQLLYQGKILKK